MKKLLMVISLVFLFCINFSCERGDRVLVGQKADVEADIQAIKGIVSEIEVAANTADIDKLVSFCADNIG